MTKPNLETLFVPDTAKMILIFISYVGAVKETLINFFGFLIRRSYIQYLMQMIDNWLQEKTTLTSGLSQTNVVENKLIMQSFSMVMSIALFFAQSKKQLKIFLILIFCNVGLYSVYIKQHNSFLTEFQYDLSIVFFLVLNTFTLYWHKSEITEINIKSKIESDSSFHRIYAEDSDLNVSDSESEEESFEKRITSSSPKLNKHIFNYSMSSKSPKQSCDSSFRSMRSPMSIYNNSVHHTNQSVRSVAASESMFMNKSLNTGPLSTSSVLNESFCSLPPSVRNMNVLSSFNVPYAQSKLTNPNNISLDSINLGFSNNCKSLNPDNLIYIPRATSSLSKRSNILIPSRLSQPLISAPIASQSWVAGGFWGQSPLNTQTPVSNRLPQVDFCPIASRTSSQSSGFESQAGSIRCDFSNNHAGQFSRESSLFNEDNDCLSHFSVSQNHSSNRTKYSNDNFNPFKHHSQPEESAFSSKTPRTDFPHVTRGRLLKDWINKTNDL